MGVLAGLELSRVRAAVLLSAVPLSVGLAASVEVALGPPETASADAARVVLDHHRRCAITASASESQPGALASRVSSRESVDVRCVDEVGVSTFRATIDDEVLLEAGAVPFEELAAARDLEILRVWFGDIALVRRRDGARADVVASELAADVARGALASAIPDYGLVHRATEITVPPNDPRYGGQWYLDEIAIESAWAITTGAPTVRIGIVDNGCDLEHQDLVMHLGPGRDVVDGDDDPTYLAGSRGNEHGTACAGVAAAQGDNAEGIAGVCPECGLSCIRLLGAPGTPTDISRDVEAFSFALDRGLEVLSNSWGFEAGVPVPGALRTAIVRVMTEGRGGLGTVVVFAAGNDAGTIRANEIQAIEGVINVGAINTFDEAASFSNRGESLALVAPTGTLTTDIRGAEGEAAGDYTSQFGGTSSAAPVVAGVAALVLAAHPTLEGAAVREVLVRTARRAPYATPDENGHDLLYGFGIVDPAAALIDLDPSLAHDAGVDSGAVDGGTSDASSTVDGGTSSAPGGCSCRAAAPSRSAHGAWTSLLVGALAMLGMRRARRRAVAAAVGSSLSLVAGCASEPVVAARQCPPGRPTADLATCVEGAALRPDTPGSDELPPRYAATDVVESVVSPASHFRIHFTRAGAHAVAARDADADGTPDFVSLVAATYDEVFARYTELGFRAPIADDIVTDDDGGDALFDVYLVDFGGSSDGAYRKEACRPTGGCAGYMLQENDFVGYSYPTTTYAVRLLASHELFHAVQAAYDGAVASGEAQFSGSTVLAEGTAVVASELFDPSLRDLEHFAESYFDRSDRSLVVDPIGASVSYSYGASLFFWSLVRAYEPAILVALLEENARGEAGHWAEALDQVLRRDHDTDFATAFRAHVERVIGIGSRATESADRSFATWMPMATGEGELTDDSVRFFPASARLFEVDGVTGGVDVRVMLGGVDATRHVLVAPLEGAGLGALTWLEGSGRVETTSDRVLIAAIDDRFMGASSVESLCIDGHASGVCDAVVVSDAGPTELTDGGTVGADASAPPMSSGGCAAATHDRARPPWELAAGGLVGLLALARRRRR